MGCVFLGVPGMFRGDEADDAGLRVRNGTDGEISLAFLEERQRRAIAEDIHDHLGQALALLRLKLVDTQGSAVFCGLDRSFEEMRSLLDQIIDYTRFLTFEISPPVLSELGFEAAISWLTRRYSRPDGLGIISTVSENAAHPPDSIGPVIFRCATELIANAAKHSGASFAEIAVDSTGQGIVLTVSDDGAGFDPSQRLGELASESKFGLLSVRERVESLGGELRIESSPGKGTRVILSVPCRMREET